MDLLFIVIIIFTLFHKIIYKYPVIKYMINNDNIYTLFYNLKYDKYQS